MHAMSRFRRGAFLGAAVIMLILPAGVVAAEDAPERQKAETTATETVQAPAALLETSTDPNGIKLELLYLSPTELEDRGSSFTDAGLGHVNTPNIVERAKLDLARAAIEASIAAGTLTMMTAPGPVLPPAPADIEAIKLEALNNPTPHAIPLEAGPDGIGGGLEPQQLSGPQAPSAEELAKLQQNWPATPNSDVPETDQPAEKTEPRPAESAESKEVR